MTLDWIDGIVGEHLQVHNLLAAVGVRIGSGKRDKDIAGAVAGNAPVSAKTERDAACESFQLMRKQWRVGSNDDDDRAAINFIKGCRGIGGVFRNFFSHGNARNPQVWADSVVALNEDAYRVASVFRAEFAGRSADSALKLVANHSRAATDDTFLDIPIVSCVNGVEGVLGLHVKTVNVVEPTVPGFSDNRQRPPITCRVGLAVGNAPLNHGVANDADTVSVGDHDGTFEETRFFNPCGAGHFTISVLGKPTCEDSVVHGIFSPRKDGCDASSNRALADLELSFSRNQSSVADKDAAEQLRIPIFLRIRIRNKNGMKSNQCSVTQKRNV